MLDDLKIIHHRDGQDALGVAEKQWQEYLHDFDYLVNGDWRPSNLVISGMGGSALAGQALGSIDLSVPLEVVRGYNLPSYVDDQTLLVCCSYSGNTEEDLSVLSDALLLAKKPQIILISAGGKLADIAKEQGLDHISIPAGYQPRASFAYQFKALAQIVEAYGLADGLLKSLEKSAESIKESVKNWRPDVRVDDNLAKQIALELVGKSAVIYSSSKMFPAAYKWKISINENAKNLAWCGQLSEFNHNEMEGWTSHPTSKPFGVVELRSGNDHPQIKKRFELGERLLSGQMPSPIVVDTPKSSSILQDMLWAIALGDFVSIYLAILNGINPTPVDLIEKFKQKLSE